MARILASLLLLSAFLGAGPARAQSGLVAAYGFNEGSGTTVADSSGHGNNGTIYGGASWTTSGKFGSALNFDGVNDMVVVPASASLNVGAALTLEAWVYPTGTQNGWRTIVNKDVDAYNLSASNPAGNLRPAGGGTVSSTGWEEADGPSAIPVNAWRHLALTYDGANLRLYVNGVQVASQPASGTLESNSNQLSFGGNAPYGEFFKGRIDEVRVYNRALSASEIQTDMSTPT
jgi:hypothetical protein